MRWALSCLNCLNFFVTSCILYYVQSSSHKEARQRRSDPGASPHAAALVWSGLGLASAEAFGRLLRKAPEAWCRVRAADEEYPCRAPQRHVRARSGQSAATSHRRETLVNAEAVPNVLLLCSLRLLLLPFQRNGLGLLSCLLSPLPQGVCAGASSLPSISPLALRCVCATLSWSILRKGCGGTMITTGGLRAVLII